MSLIKNICRFFGDGNKMRAVLFDLDGVITDTAEYHYQAWKELSAELGISLDRQFNEELKGVSRLASLEKILSLKPALQFSKSEKEALAAKKNQIYLKSIQSMTNRDVLPGIMSLLEELKAKGYKIALASASKNGPLILELLGLGNYFDKIANPDDVLLGKPAPDIFLEAAHLLDIDPGECVAIEDAHAGVTAIKAAKMIAIGIGDSRILKDADKVVSQTNDLSLDFLEKVWLENQHFNSLQAEVAHPL